MEISVLTGIAEGRVHLLTYEQLQTLNRQIDSGQIDACIELQMFFPQALHMAGSGGLLDGKDEGLGMLRKLIKSALFAVEDANAVAMLAKQFSDGNSTLPKIKRFVIDFAQSQYK